MRREITISVRQIKNIHHGILQRLRFRDCPTGHTFVLGSCAPGGKVLDQFEMYNPYLGKYILLIHYILRMCINFNIIYTYFFLELKIIKYQI